MRSARCTRYVRKTKNEFSNKVKKNNTDVADTTHTPRPNSMRGMLHGYSLQACNLFRTFLSTSKEAS